MDDNLIICQVTGSASRAGLLGSTEIAKVVISLLLFQLISKNRTMSFCSVIVTGLLSLISFYLSIPFVRMIKYGVSLLGISVN